MVKKKSVSLSQTRNFKQKATDVYPVRMQSWWASEYEYGALH